LKPKFHFLVHAPLFIRRFGPAIIFSTERYESFNRVFRLASIYSNRQAPSRDACTAFASQDIVKHVATGGYWFDRTANKWLRAGCEIHTYMRDHPERAQLLGIPVDKEHMLGKWKQSFTINVGLNQGNAGEANLPRKKAHTEREAECVPVNWSETHSAKIGNPALPTQSTFYQASSFKALHGDVVKLGKYIIFMEKGDEKVSLTSLQRT
jgi:hypothetical protein